MNEFVPLIVYERVSHPEFIYFPTAHLLSHSAIHLRQIRRSMFPSPTHSWTKDLRIKAEHSPSTICGRKTTTEAGERASEISPDQYPTYKLGRTRQLCGKPSIFPTRPSDGVRGSFEAVKAGVSWTIIAIEMSYIVTACDVLFSGLKMKCDFDSLIVEFWVRSRKCLP